MTQANNEIFFNFIPIYNIYNRYKRHDFENNHNINQEMIHRISSGFFLNNLSIIVLYFSLIQIQLTVAIILNMM